ncbi:hypothetical protein CCACVL1_29826 [Corchorus capsularis]|uniref:Uncharacterized protein n=1 Tax=Corchorus capsularis TaxID=210143 RepID=A0A1R3FZV9_COCAP|nr:hypothetical protein CCACVL1_29826 [Corchorus capsularis]
MDKSCRNVSKLQCLTGETSIPPLPYEYDAKSYALLWLSRHTTFAILE